MNSRPLGVAFGLVGLVVVVLGVVLLLHGKTPSSETATTTGTVVGGRFTDDGCVNTATFVVHGHSYSAVQRVGHRTACVYPNGAVVTVHYAPSDPNDATLGTSGSVGFLGPLAFVVIGAVFTVAGARLALTAGGGTSATPT